VTISEQAEIGNRVYIGHNVVVHAGARIGENTSIQDHAVIGRQPISSSISTRQAPSCDPICIGENCIIGSHVVLYAGVTLEDNVMVADLASIREGTSVGMHSINGRGVLVEYDTIIGKRCKIQTGSHVTGNMIIEDDVFFGGEVHTMNDKQLDRVKGLPMEGPHI
jgi:UDP-3-O-[3-hydroxymyristoyl] glucosamine N-acyltransferase